MKKKILYILGGVLLTSLIIVGMVQAFGMGNVDGVWGQIDIDGKTTIDVIGVIGEDPGDYWGTDPDDTDNVDMRRESDVCTGDSDGSNTFDPATEWDFYLVSNISHLGDATGLCSGTAGLIISEYYESDDTTRAIEVYNGTGATVNLNDYNIVVYKNGSSSYSEICFLHGTLANGEVHVLTDGDESLSTKADEICTSLNFTGDDAVELRRGNEADATDSRWATNGNGNNDNPEHEQEDYWDQTTGYSNTDTNQVRYGTESSFSNKSGLGFDGVNDIGIITPGDIPSEPSEPFLLGLLTHYNNPISRYIDSEKKIHYNNLYKVPLEITVDGIFCHVPAEGDPIPPSEGTTLTFDYTIKLEETPNEADPCPYGEFNGECSDRIWITAGSSASTAFTCQDTVGEDLIPANEEGIWTLEILGFTDNDQNLECPSEYPGGVMYSFDSEEDLDSTACLWARISEFNPTSVTFADFSAHAGSDGILVSWGTVSEVNNSGFYLYRSTTPTKPFEPMATFIPSQAPGSGEGASYEFFDAKVQSGVKYYYWIESVDFEDRAVDEYGPAEARAWLKLFLPLIGR